MRARVSILAVLALLGCHTESSTFGPVPLKTFSLEEVIPLRPDFYPERLTVQWISDTEYIYSDPNKGIQKYDASNDSHVSVIKETELQSLSNYSVETFSKDGKYVLLTINKQKVYRYSTLAVYYIYDLETKMIVNLSPDPLQVVVWGGGRSLAYVKENNVYYLPDITTSRTVTVLTNEGVPEMVYFGVADWIYEEEIFNAAEALWFSPSGDYLAVASFNDTNVESAIYPFYGNPLDMNNQYSHLVGFKYPKAGRANPVVGLRVFNVNDPTTYAWTIPAPEVLGPEFILGRVNWATDNNIIVLWLNRRQNHGILVSCVLTQDKCTIVKERYEPNGWIDIDQPFFGDNGTIMVEKQPMPSGQQRFMHIVRFNLDTMATDDLTPMNGTVTEILGWNPEKDVLFYIVAPLATPWQRQLWSTSANGLNLQCISCVIPSCNHAAGMFSPNATYGIVTCSATNVPASAFLYKVKDNSFKSILNNTDLNNKLSQYNLPMPLFSVIELEPTVVAHVKLILPPNMDKNKKYPMIVRVYAGPGTTRVKDSFDLDYYSTYLASNRSFIVASIDVRGSGVMGLDSLYAVNNALGTVEITDTLAAIRRLVSQYSFIDPERIGVWGWSYGGYASTMMLIRDDNNTIACGAAVAPVTSWLYYDTIYTERYMDVPQKNRLGYKQSDLMLAAEKLRGRMYLLVHGTGDDNVHYQHSLQLAKVLQHADISFEQMSYTDETHSLLGVSRHFYHTLDHFWTQCFYHSY